MTDLYACSCNSSNHVETDCPYHGEWGVVNFPYECDCGERYSTIHGAQGCRKCWKYLDHDCTHVTDLRTDEVVWDSRTDPRAEPVLEAYAEAFENQKCWWL